jgi:hypothetical protein
MEHISKEINTHNIGTNIIIIYTYLQNKIKWNKIMITT